MGAGVQRDAVPVGGFAVGKAVQQSQQLGLGQPAVGEQHLHTGVLIGGLPALRPADHRGVAQGLAVFAVCQQVVERLRVGGGGVAAHRGVAALLVSVGAEGVGVEGNNGSTGGLRPRHTLDGRVQPRQRGLLPGDQTAHGRGVVLGAAAALPRRANVGVIQNKSAVGRQKFDVAALHQLVPMGLQHRAFGGGSRLPRGKKRAYRCGGAAGGVLQNVLMQRAAGGKALRGAFRFALGVHA